MLMHYWLLATVIVAAALVAVTNAADGSQANSPAVNRTLGNMHYMILAPTSAQLGSVYTVSIALLTGEAIASARASIITLSASPSGRNLSLETEWSSGQGMPAVDLVILSIRLDNDDTIDLGGSYRLNVQLNGSSGSVYSNKTSVQLTSPSFLTFVQTDKAVYQPGQTVKFRVVCLDETLKPVFTNFTVLVKDAKGNLVDRLRHELPATDQTAASRNASIAVMQGQFDLADLPNLGSWRIEASGGRGQQQTKSFTVDRYTLPKFSIDLRLPEFVQYNDSEFNVTVTVQYTYRQAVQGRVKAELGPWNPCRDCKNKYDLVKTFEVDLNGSNEGQTSFTFQMGEWRDTLVKRAKEFDTSFNWMSSFNAKAFVQFTEKFSGVAKTAEATFTIYRTRFRLIMKIPNASFFLPGMRIPVQMSLERPNSKPYTGILSSDVRLILNFSYRSKSKSTELYKGRMTQSPSGTGVSLMVTVPDYADFSTIIFNGKIESESEEHGTASASLNPFMALTDDFVLAGLHLDNQGVQLAVNRSTGIKLMTAAVLSRGQIHKWLRIESDENQNALTIPRESLPALIPSFSVIVFGIVESGEVVASYAEYSVPSVTGKLNLTTNLTDNTGEPQEFASINISGDPNTFVFITGIDASVNLIATGQDILESTVTDELRGRHGLHTRSWIRSYTTEYVLQITGLKLLSDGFYYIGKSFSHLRPPFPLGLARSAMFEVASVREGDRAEIDNSVESPGQSSVKSQKRKFFPETMVWTMVQTDMSGEANQTLQLPDTITSWDVTAFGIGDHSAIQTVPRALKMTTFKRFFASPTLPHSLVRGESLVLRVLLFNYYKATDTMTVNVTLDLSDAFASESLHDRHLSVEVGPNSIGLAVFTLRPTKVADAAAVSVLAKAIWPDGRVEVDEVTRTLPVLPEGRTVRRSRTALLSLAKNGNGSSETEASATLSVEWTNGTDGETLVEGSEVLDLTVIGDALGPAMDGIGGLVRTPHGCGEQNMVDFAPAVFVYRYLASNSDTADSVSDALRKKALAAMRTGYQRQLTFRRQDGSYSAFGSTDPVGSVWLTSFVLSVFAQAADFITVDSDTVTGDSVAFILARQDASGRFSEPDGGRVLDSGLQGAAGRSSLGMSAFVCSALLDVWEAAEAASTLRSPVWSKLAVTPAIDRCAGLFQNELSSRPGDFDARDLALTAHFLWRLRRSALRGADNGTLDKVWAAFNALAVTADGGGGTSRYWQVSGVPSEEATAYGVLSALLADGAESALPSLRWLNGRQNDRGGFSDTQSTVVAVRALAAFAAAVGGSGPTHANVEFKAAEQSIEFVIQPETRRVLQRRPVGRGAATSRVAEIGVRAVGRGLVLATASWQFNLRDARRRFLTANWTNRSGVGLRIGAAPPVPAGAVFAFSVCARSSAGEGMYILRISCPSGYLPVGYTLSGRDSNLKLVEAGADQLVFYFNQLTMKEDCIQSAWQRDVPVLNVGPQMITLQKYYQPDVSNTAFYLDPKLQGVTQCDACPDCPGCEKN